MAACTAIIIIVICETTVRALLFNTKEVAFVLGEASSRPLGIVSHKSDDDERVHTDVALCFLCVERGDTLVDAISIENDIFNYVKLVGRKVLLVPFVHLTSTPAAPDAARNMLERVAKDLGERHVLSGVTGFGFHKALLAKWVTIAHKGDVAFRDSRFLEQKL